MLQLKLLVALIIAGSLNQAVYAEDYHADKKMGTTSNVSNQFWWPERLDLAPLRQHSEKSNPMGAKFNYAKEFQKLDLKAVKSDIEKLMKTSQDWWSAEI